MDRARNIVQEAATKTIPKKRKCKKAKWLSNEALEIAERRREAKCKGDRESYRKLNADFQRIARRDKRAFLTEQCKEIEENNRKGKTRDIFKKIRDIKGNFCAKMNMIKEKMAGTSQKQKTSRRGGKNTQSNYTRKIWISRTTHRVWLLTLSQTSWRVKSSGP